MSIKEELLGIIEQNAPVTYYEIVQASQWSPQKINQTLTQLKKQGLIQTIDMPKQKARGWILKPDMP